MIALYASCQTQWRSGMSGATGLDYAGVEALGRLRGEPISPDTFAGLQICEGAALAVINERRERDERQAQQSQQARSARGGLHAW